MNADDAPFERFFAFHDYGAAVISGLLTSGRNAFKLGAQGVFLDEVVVGADADFEIVKTIVKLVDAIEDDDAVDFRFVIWLQG